MFLNVLTSEGFMHLGVVAIDEMVKNTRRIYTVEFGFSFMDPRESQISDACLEMVWARTIGYGPGIGWSHITELSFCVSGWWDISDSHNCHNHSVAGVNVG